MDGHELRRLFVLANAFKEGDLAVGGSADSALRDDARRLLSKTTIGAIRRTAVVDDGITSALDRSRDRSLDGQLDPLTIADLKAILLSPAAADWASSRRDTLASEAIAAVAKVMTNDELSSVACRLFNPIQDRSDGIGGPRHFGSRIQPNSPGDDENEILFSILEGLS